MKIITNTQQKNINLMMEEQKKLSEQQEIIKEQYEKIIEQIQETSSKMDAIVSRLEEFIRVSEIEQKYEHEREQRQNKPWYKRILCM